MKYSSQRESFMKLNTNSIPFLYHDQLLLLLCCQEPYGSHKMHASHTSSLNDIFQNTESEFNSGFLKFNSPSQDPQSGVEDWSSTLR